MSIRCILMILHISRMRRNANRNVYKPENVSATTCVSDCSKRWRGGTNIHRDAIAHVLSHLLQAELFTWMSPRQVQSVPQQ